jgi:hypothetical protein
MLLDIDAWGDGSIKHPSHRLYILAKGKHFVHGFTPVTPSFNVWDNTCKIVGLVLVLVL